MYSKLLCLLLCVLYCKIIFSQDSVRLDDTDGLWTYRPSFEALGGIKDLKMPGPGEENLFLLPERNFFKVGNVKVYKCDICNYKTLKDHEYAEHMKEKHFYPGFEEDDKWIHDVVRNQDYNYTCNTCGEVYKNHAILIWHLCDKEHFNDSDHEFYRQLRGNLILNETVGRKVIYHPLVRPFHREGEPDRLTIMPERDMESAVRGFNKAKYISNVDISSGDVSNQALNDDIINLGWSKYCKDDFSKHVKKVNGVNVYQRTPDISEQFVTDETKENQRLKQASAYKAREKFLREDLLNDTDEFLRREEAESMHSASYYRREIDQYGPFASTEDHVGDRIRRKYTKRIVHTKIPPVNERGNDPFQ